MHDALVVIGEAQRDGLVGWTLGKLVQGTGLDILCYYGNVLVPVLATLSITTMIINYMSVFSGTICRLNLIVISFCLPDVGLQHHDIMATLTS